LVGSKLSRVGSFGTGSVAFGTATKAAAKRPLLRTPEQPRLSGLISGTAELRKARTLTQEQLAATLGVTQAQVSRIEHQTDLYLSTLAGYLEAMGGHLELVGVFGTARVSLSLAAVAGDALQTA
jgi:hypothetical protein